MLNSEKIYLFRSGSFYLFLGEDAEVLNRELGLKLIKFSNETMKCGFPVGEYEKYSKFIKLIGYEYEIVLDEINQVVEDILNIDVNIIDGKSAVDKINFYKSLLSSSNNFSDASK
jgi:DNA mismatch repair ATPase MutS